MSDNTERFNKKISSMTLQGWSIVDRNDSRLECVLEKKGKECNHILHVILTLLLCVWGIVWYLKANEAKKQSRVRISFDSSGNLLEEKVQL